jgi:hypothetical protein
MILTHTLFSSGKQMNPCSELNAAQVLCLDSPMQQIVHKSEHVVHHPASNCFWCNFFVKMQKHILMGFLIFWNFLQILKTEIEIPFTIFRFWFLFGIVFKLVFKNI